MNAQEVKRLLAAMAAFLDHNASEEQIALLDELEMVVDLGGLRGWSLTDIGEGFIARILRAVAKNQ